MKKVLQILVLALAVSANVFGQWTQSSTIPGLFSAMSSEGQTVVAAKTGSVYLSNDNGATFTSISTGIPASAQISDIIITGSKIYLATSVGLYYSSNSGSSWITINGNLPNSNITTITKKGFDIYAGINLSDSTGIYKSSDNGTTWTLKNAGIPCCASPPHNIYNLRTIDNIIYANIYASTTYLSNDDGDSWSYAGNGIDIYGMGIDIVGNASHLFQISSMIGEIYHSPNVGNSWTNINNGIGGTHFNAIAFDGINLCTSTSNNNVFLSTNQGTSWLNINNNLPSASVTKLSISGNYLIVTLNNQGIWRFDLSILSGINKQNINNYTTIYPNPTSDILNIKSTNLKANSNIEITNAYGQVVLSEKGTTGNAKVNMQHLPSGIYFAKITNANGVVEINKVVKR